MFTKISVPTPFQVGRVNTFVAGRTVVDPGPDSEEAWADLLDGLDERSLAPGDIEAVWVTHPHPDHFGLAGRLRAAGADVVTSPLSAEIMANFDDRLAYEQSFFRPYFERCGLSAETARTVTELPEMFLPYGPNVETDREVTAGETIDIDDTTFTVTLTKGHAPEEVIFSYEEDGQRRALVGDHVLEHITPNPLLLPPREEGGERPRALPQYNDSLARLRDAGYDHFLTGHGEDVTDPAGRIDAILAAHEERTEAVYELVDGPTAPADVMHGLFDDLPATEQFSGMSEAIGHLDVLELRGKVRQRKSGDVIVYERTD